MKKLLVVVVLLTAELFPAVTPDSLIEINMGGPRLGLTYMFLTPESQKQLDQKEIGNLISQFGWHFEYAVAPRGSDLKFLIEFVPLLAGVEFGKIIPSGTLGIGLRFASGVEFGMGPNLLISDEGVKTGLMVSLGYAVPYGNVNLPLNLVAVKSPSGVRVSFIFGYAL